RVWKVASHVTRTPLHDLLWSGAPVHENRHVAGKKDVEAAHRLTLLRDDIPGLESDQTAAGGEPGDLVGRRAGQQPVLGQAIMNRGFRFGHLVNTLYIRVLQPGRTIVGGPQPTAVLLPPPRVRDWKAAFYRRPRP